VQDPLARAEVGARSEDFPLCLADQANARSSGRNVSVERSRRDTETARHVLYVDLRIGQERLSNYN